MKTLPKQINRIMTRSKTVISLQNEISQRNSEMKELRLKQKKTREERDSLKLSVDKLKKEKFLLERVIKKKSYEMEELERNHFLKQEGLKDIYEKKMSYLESSKQEEMNKMQVKFDRWSNQNWRRTERKDSRTGDERKRTRNATEGTEKENGRNQNPVRVGETSDLQRLAEKHRKSEKHARTGAPKQNFGDEHQNEQNVRLQPKLFDQQVHERNRRNQNDQRCPSQEREIFSLKKKNQNLNKSMNLLENTKCNLETQNKELNMIIENLREDLADLNAKFGEIDQIRRIINIARFSGKEKKSGKRGTESINRKTIASSANSSKSCTRNLRNWF